jgi:hypothetical protein
MTIISTDVAKYKGDTPLCESIFVKSVYGGEETNPLWMSQIGNNAFRGALEDSLLAARLLERVEGKGIYSLEVKLMSVDQPFIGASFTVTTNIRYILRHVKSDKVIFEENILAPYTATMSDALYGVERLRLANEGSARENISRLIARLYQLNIQDRDITIIK